MCIYCERCDSEAIPEIEVEKDGVKAVLERNNIESLPFSYFVRQNGNNGGTFSMEMVPAAEVDGDNYSLRIHTTNENPRVFKINYCPICGRKLSDSVPVITKEAFFEDLQNAVEMKLVDELKRD